MFFRDSMCEAERRFTSRARGNNRRIYNFNLDISQIQMRPLIGCCKNERAQFRSIVCDIKDYYFRVSVKICYLCSGDLNSRLLHWMSVGDYLWRRNFVPRWSRFALIIPRILMQLSEVIYVPRCSTAFRSEGIRVWMKGAQHTDSLDAIEACLCAFVSVQTQTDLPARVFVFISGTVSTGTHAYRTRSDTYACSKFI